MKGRRSGSSSFAHFFRLLRPLRLLRLSRRALCSLSPGGEKIGAGGRSRTDTVVTNRRILSPVRLPVPPLRHKGKSYGRSYEGPYSTDFATFLQFECGLRRVRFGLRSCQYHFSHCDRRRILKAIAPIPNYFDA